MTPNTPWIQPGPKTGTRSDYPARLFVWSVLVIMIVADLFILVHSARMFPFNEDWWLVPVLTGHESNLAEWLWLQNSEHRIPFPRLILLGLLKAGHGDVRVGMLFNIAILGALALAMILTARHVRGGRTSFADAFFPVILLHIGNAENLFWSWQLTQVVPTVLTSIILLVLVANQTVTTALAAVTGGIALILLPLSGSHALIFAPPLSMWFAYCALLHWRTPPAPGRRRWVSAFLIVSATVALTITVFHIVTYQRPSWLPADPTVAAALTTAVKFLALAFGPTARNDWTAATIAIMTVILATSILAIWAVIRHTGHERLRAFGLLIFFGVVMVLALATGWGRATAIESVYGGQYQLRYVLMAAPVLLVSYFVWELYGAKRLRIAVCYALFVTMCFLLPANTLGGLNWLYWFADKDALLEQDLRNGTSPTLLAERHREILLHWEDPKKIDNLIRMLRDSGIGPFAYAGSEPSDHRKPEGPAVLVDGAAGLQTIGALNHTLSSVTGEIRHALTRGHTVYLVWRLHNTEPEGGGGRDEKKDDPTYTRMIPAGEIYTASIRIPRGGKLTYGFQMVIEKRDLVNRLWPGWPAWDWNEGKGYQLIASQDAVTTIQAPLTLQRRIFSIEFGRYLLLALGIVFCGTVGMTLMLTPRLGRRINASGINVSKLIVSLTMRQFHSFKNRFVKAGSEAMSYRRFHSQFGEDRWIFKHVELPERGVFVDIGAGHPSYLSNTYMFEKNGWRGLCIDADPSQINLLRKQRNNVEWAAISSQEGEINLSLAYFPTYSSTVGKERYGGFLKVPFTGTMRVPSFRLETLLEKHNIRTIDVLSIDVEGTELEVWKTFDYQKHKPKVLIIEYCTFGLPDNARSILHAFSALPYQLVHKTCTNFIFLNTDKNGVGTTGM